MLLYFSVPTLLFCVAWPAFWPWELPFKAYLSPSPPINLLYPFVYIFAIVITYRQVFLLALRRQWPCTEPGFRAITTKHKLESFKAEEALRVLLTTHERNSWRAIYAIPGLLPALFLEVVLRWLFLQLGHQLLQPFDLGPRYPSRKAQYETTELSIGICLAVASFATVFLAPLEVIVTRLAIQRNYGPALKPKPAEASIKPSQTEVVDLEKGVVAGEKASVVFDATEEKNESSKVREVAAEARVSEKDVPVSPTTGVDPETADTDADLEPATNIEPGDSAVIRYAYYFVFPVSLRLTLHRLRNENEQYTGLINCAKTIIKDEGWKPLYRMCFVTFCGIMTTLVQL